MTALSTPTRSADPAPAVPAAVRFQRPGWRDPRLVIGVLLVSLSVVLGARLLSSSDDVSQVWAVQEAVAAGETIGAQDVRPARVRFVDAADAERYVSADTALADGAVVTRELAAGELLPLEAVTQEKEGLLELPVAVAGAGVPATLVAGDRVDVWVVPRARATTRAARAQQVLRDVPVLRIGGRGLGGPESTRQVVVGVDQGIELTGPVGQLADSDVVLVRRP